VRIIVEALLRLEGGDEGAFAAAGGLETLKEGIQSYLDVRKVGKDAFADEETKEQWVDNLEYLAGSLLNLSPVDGSYQVSSILPPPSLPSISSSSSSSFEETSEPLYLPMILVPPELEETDLTLVSHGANTHAGGAEKAIPAPSTSAGLRGDEGVGYEGTRLSLRLFDDETVPGPDDKAGNVLRGLITDIVNLYEVNRKEGAGVLLELPRWVKKGTFKDPKAPKKTDEDDEEMQKDDEPVEGPMWSLENLIVEVSKNILRLVFRGKLTGLHVCRLFSTRYFAFRLPLILSPTTIPSSLNSVDFLLKRSLHRSVNPFESFTHLSETILVREVKSVPQYSILVE